MTMVGRQMTGRLLVTVVLLAGLVACNPKFPNSASLGASQEGDGVRLTWPAANVDPDKTLASYRVDVDGAEVARLDPSVSSCLLTGLASGADHEVRVTAYDSTGQWSGNSAFTASVTASVTGPAVPPAAEVRCDVVDPPAPASVDVVLSQPSPGAGTKVIGGQVAPVSYGVTVTNSGDLDSDAVTVTVPVPAGSTIVDDSASCDDAPGCSVAIDGTNVVWSLDSVAANATIDLALSVTVNPELGTTTELQATASFTNVASPGCVDPVCTSNTVTNPAEPWTFVGGNITPRNSIFYNGPNNFRPSGYVSNDPAATITYDWSCLPDTLCLFTLEGEVAHFNFVWDPFESVGWTMMLVATATQGDRTLSVYKFMDFRLEERFTFVCGDPAQCDP